MGFYSCGDVLSVREATLLAFRQQLEQIFALEMLCESELDTSHATGHNAGSVPQAAFSQNLRNGDDPLLRVGVVEGR
eukprot:Skav224318  [mRNA]  locus=scaffold227:486510:486740:- [translate_table: standard]